MREGTLISPFRACRRGESFWVLLEECNHVLLHRQWQPALALNCCDTKARRRERQPRAARGGEETHLFICTSGSLCRSTGMETLAILLHFVLQTH